MSLQDYRKKFPEYDDIPDDQLIQGLHKKYGDGMDLSEFSRKIGHINPETSGEIDRSPSPHRQFLDRQMLASSNDGQAPAGGEGVEPLPDGAQPGMRTPNTAQSAVQQQPAPDFSQRLGMTGQDVMQAAADRQPEDPWGEVLLKTAQNLPEKAKRVLGGAMQDIGDESNIVEANPWVMMNPLVWSALGVTGVDPLDAAEAYGPKVNKSIRSLRESIGLGKINEITDELSAELEKRGRSIWEDATKKIEANQPNVKRGSAKYYASAILGSMAEMGPALLASYLTKNPNIGIAIMSGQVYADKYGDAINEGRTPKQATMDGLFYAATEGLTEKIPLGILTKEGTRWLARTLKAAGAEGVQEVFAEAMQMGYEQGVLDKDEDLTLGQAMRRLWDAGIIGMGAGGGLAVVTGPIANTQNPQRQLGRALDQDISETDLRAVADMQAREALSPDQGVSEESLRTERRADPERAAEGDRRQDASLREQIRQGQLPPEEVERLLYRSEVAPELENKRAFDEVEEDGRPTFFMDLDEFKKNNERYTYAGADQIIRAAGEIQAQVAGELGIEPFHYHGDEFTAKADNPELLQRYGEELQKRAADAIVDIELADGRRFQHKGIPLSFGIGANKSEAETNLKTDKQRRAEAGLRQDRVADTGPEPGRQDSGGPPAQEVTPDFDTLVPEQTPSQEGVSRSEGRKEPWQMSRKEWEAAREKVRPNIAQANFTRSAGSEAEANFNEMQRLTYGARDAVSQKMRDAQDGKIKLTQEEAEELQDELNRRITHRDVVEKALQEGQAVPREVLAEYPDLKKKTGKEIPKPETGESAKADNNGESKQSGTKLYANPVEPIIDAYQKVAGKAFDYVGEKIGYHFSPLGKLPEQQAFLKARYRTLGKVGDVENIVDEIYNTFKGAKNPEAIYEFLTTKDASPAGIEDPAIRKKAIATKRLIDRVGRGLVNRGLLSQQAYERHKGSYLPRIYLKHLLDENAFRAIGTGKKPSDMGYLKQRKGIPKDIRDVILGEIHDPAFLASKGVGRSMRDIALLDFMDQISQNEQWAHPDYLVEMNGRKVSVYWLKNEADRLRAQSRHQQGEVAEKAKALADKMDQIANQKLEGAPADPENFRQMPDQPRYGMLRGMYVRKEIYDDIVGIGQLTPESSGFFERLLGYGGYGTKVTQLWKMSKVALNPPTQVRNFVSNGILLHLSGVPFVRVPDRVIAAVRQIRTNGKYWRIAKKYGLTASTFNANELFRIERQLLDLKAKQKGAFSMAQLNRMGGIIAKGAGDVYQFSEAIFKTAKIMDAMNRDGLSEADAMIEAQKWLYDYSLIPRGVRYLRNAPIGIPFITFYYKTLPRMMEVAVKHPARFAPYVAMSYALTAAITSLYDVDDDDVEQLKNTMPKWLQEKGTSYVLPYKDKHGRWQAVNLEYFYPWSMYTEFVKESIKGNYGDAIKTTGILGGPIPDIIAAIKTNKDPFTGMEIVNSMDPPSEQIKQLLTYVWSLAMPPWVGEYGFVNKMRKSITGEVNKRGDLPLTPEQAMLNLFGVNIYPFEPEEQRRRNISWMQYEIGEIRKRASSLLRNDALSAEDKKNIRKVYQEIIREKQAALKDYRNQTKLHPNLTAKEAPTDQEADRDKSERETGAPVL